MEKTVEVNYSVSKVYSYLHDLHNLLGFVKNYRVEYKNYHDAIIKIPIIPIRIVITTPLIENEYIKAVSDTTIGTTIEIFLESLDSEKTRIKVKMECNPSGFLKKIIRERMEEGFKEMPEFIKGLDFSK